MTQSTVLLNNNVRHRKYSGVQKFHDAGYYGERVVAASGESWDLNSFNPDNLCSDPLSVGSSTGHPIETASTFFQVAPKAKLIMLDTGGKYNGDGTFESNLLKKSTPIIEQYGVTNMFTSLLHNGNTNEFDAISKWLQSMPNLKSYWCAGNDAGDAYSKILQVDEVIGVAAYKIMVDMTIIPASYSSVTKYVDFSAPSYTYTNINATKSTDGGTPRNGTSFSTPWLCGMSCLVDDFFIDKTGKPLTREKMYQFMKDHTVDIGTVGFDTKCGFGAVVLPDPSEIDIDKYRGDDMLEKFSDANQVSSWATEAVEYCLNKGYLNGKGNNMFAPQATLTREEFCCVIKRVVDNLSNA